MSIEGRPDRDRSLAHHPRRARRRRHADRHRRRLPPARRRGRPQRGADRRGAAPWGGDADDVLVATKGGHLRPGDGSWTLDGSPEHLREAVRGLAQAPRRRRDRALPVPPSRPARCRTRSPWARSRDLLDEGKIAHGGHLQRQPGADPPAQDDPRRPAGQRAEPVLAGLPLQRAGAASCATSWASPSCPGARWAASRRPADLGSPFAPFAEVADAHGVSPQQVAPGLDAGPVAGGHPDPGLVAARDDARLGRAAGPRAERRRAAAARRRGLSPSGRGRRTSPCPFPVRRAGATSCRGTGGGTVHGHAGRRTADLPRAGITGSERPAAFRRMAGHSAHLPRRGHHRAPHPRGRHPARRATPARPSRSPGGWPAGAITAA